MPSGTKKRTFIPEGAPGHPHSGSAKSPSFSSKTRRDGPAGRSGRGPAKADGRGDRDGRTDRGFSLAGKAVRSLPAARREQPRLVYEDEDILAYDKPSGLPVIAADGSRAHCLLNIASTEVRKKNPKGRAAVVHRIDRDTSGIVIFARNANIKRELMANWDQAVRERLYVALVEGEMESDSGTFDSWLKEDDKGRVSVAKSGARGAKRAITDWKLVAKTAGLSLVELSLQTGRKHQIRVQLANAGHPVLGDSRYGARRLDIPRLCLHATSIQLEQAKKPSLHIESPMPKLFQALLDDARREEARHHLQADRPKRPRDRDGASGSRKSAGKN